MRLQSVDADRDELHRILLTFGEMTNGHLALIVRILRIAAGAVAGAVGEEVTMLREVRRQRWHGHFNEVRSVVIEVADGPLIRGKDHDERIECGLPRLEGF